MFPLYAVGSTRLNALDTVGTVAHHRPVVSDDSEGHGVDLVAHPNVVGLLVVVAVVVGSTGAVAVAARRLAMGNRVTSLSHDFSFSS